MMYRYLVILLASCLLLAKPINGQKVMYIDNFDYSDTNYFYKWFLNGTSIIKPGSLQDGAYIVYDDSISKHECIHGVIKNGLFTGNYYFNNEGGAHSLKFLNGLPEGMCDLDSNYLTFTNGKLIKMELIPPFINEGDTASETLSIYMQSGSIDSILIHGGNYYELIKALGYKNDSSVGKYAPYMMNMDSDKGYNFPYNISCRYGDFYVSKNFDNVKRLRRVSFSIYIKRGEVDYDVTVILLLNEQGKITRVCFPALYGGNVVDENGYPVIISTNTYLNILPNQTVDFSTSRTE